VQAASRRRTERRLTTFAVVEMCLALHLITAKEVAQSQLVA
jgi:hypothetical protein